MKKSHKLLVLACCTTLFVSCFKEELPNAECDIEKVTLHVDMPDEVFRRLSDSVPDVFSDHSEIIIEVKEGADVSSITPHFQITEGATIVPASGLPQDFTQGSVTYTVTSEDKAWARTYVLSVHYNGQMTGEVMHFNFDNYYMSEDEKYYIWHHTSPSGAFEFDWGTANPGYTMANSTAAPHEYPTAPDSSGVDGNACVRLTTCATKGFAAMLGKRIAAGNLYIGDFDFSAALGENSAKASKFGRPFNQIPKYLSGYYKYQPGEELRDGKGTLLPEQTDSASIYAMLYRNQDKDGNEIRVDGTCMHTSPYIVAKAEMSYVRPSNAWTPYEVPFVYTEEIDTVALENYGYSLALIFCSSKDGDTFKGAVGSTLWLDRIRITYATTQKENNENGKNK